ncbi:MAG: hydroxymethylbilane synthase [Candidatus Thorarchaeota archaeon]
MLKIGARDSKLSKQQVFIVQDLLKKQINLDSSFIPIKSVGDKDLNSPIHKIENEGVFTSTLEEALLSEEIDLAVHSLKDLPTEISDKLAIVAIIKRNDPTDTLLVKKSSFNRIDENSWDILPNTRIATGSERRKSQLLDIFPECITIDVRGNVDTRLRKLHEGLFDGLMMASAVFERLNLDINNDIIKIKLNTDRFPTAPGQGAICLEMKKDHDLYEQIKILNHEDTARAVTIERDILKFIGGGCQLPLGLTVYKIGDYWKLISTLAPLNWKIYESPPISRTNLLVRYPEELIPLFIKGLAYNKGEPHINNCIQNKKILLAGSKETAIKYSVKLESLGAFTQIIDSQTFSEIWDEKTIDTYKDKWLNASWVVLTSKRAINGLKAFMIRYPNKKVKIATVGPATTKEVQKSGFPVHFQASKSDSMSLANEFSRFLVQNDNILFLASKNALSNIKSILTEKNIGVNQISVYQGNTNNTRVPLFFTPPVDYILVFSPKYARSILDLYGQNIANNWICFGQATKQVLEDYSMRNVIQPKSFLFSHILEVLN